MVIQFILPTDQFPLQTPFRRATIHNDISSGGDTIWCSGCESSSTINVSSVQTDFNKRRGRNVADKRTKAISLADCSDAYASISGIAANSHDRSMSIISCYIRAMMLRCDCRFSILASTSQMTAQSNTLTV